MSALDCPPFDDFERKTGDDHPIEDNDDKKEDRAIEVEKGDKACCFADGFSERPKLEFK